MPANPVFQKELRACLRFGGLSVVWRVGIGAAVAVPLAFVYFKAFESLRHDPSSANGHSLWTYTVCLQFVFVCLLAPAAAANAITQEREQQTWDTLVFTRLTPGEIVLGKLLARFAVVPAILALGLPLALAGALYANHSKAESVTPLQFVGVYITLLIIGLLFITVSLYLSWRLRSTLYVIMGAYTFVIGGLIIGTFLVSGMLAALLGNSSFMQSCPLLWFNPVLLIKNAVWPAGRSDTLLLICGLTGYLALTALMLRRMAAGFDK